MKIKGSVVLKKKTVMDTTDLIASFVDRLYEAYGNGVSLQLISADYADPGNESRGKLGEEAFLEEWISTLASLTAEDVKFNVTFEWEDSFGLPGAFIIKNHHHSEFHLKTLTLEDVPGYGQLDFVCNSWVYPANGNHERVFFLNKTYLPNQTPEALLLYREEELNDLRGNDESRMLQVWDRVYDYAFYNDLGAPERGPDYVRPILGGSRDYPYPRRGKTGRAPNGTDPNTESRLPLINLSIYVPRDEHFTHIKYSDFVAYAVKSLGQVLRPEAAALFERNNNEFSSFQDVLDLFEGDSMLPDVMIEFMKLIPFEFFKALFSTDGEALLKFPMPEVIADNNTAWRTDEEFAREMLAGVNPVVIRRLEEFPPASKLDPKIYGTQTSSITKEHIEDNMDGQTVEEALMNNKLFILDHHDSLMPYLERINTTTTKTYATRTVLLLKTDGTLKPLAIELSLNGATSLVFTPAEQGIRGSFWQLAKAYAAVNDSGYHQLISHWLNTHAVIEPFVIATYRQLSVLHPIHKLLQPHFRDTMNINALARHTLINAGGILELTVFPGKYAMEMSSSIYKNWVFTEQGLPADLLKRGVAIVDSSEPHGVKLLIEDYPYAVDGLEIWSAIKDWVNEYCSFYYQDDKMVQDDKELKSWWEELRDVGHGDLKDEPWWPKMNKRDELVQTCTIIIWVASALHAAVNFGQYSYAGYLPNRPTVSRRFMPVPHTPEYTELESNPDSAFLKTITAQFQTLLGVSLIEILSRHTSDEIYLGQRDYPKWTSDPQPLEAFANFSTKLIEIEKGIIRRNNDAGLRNRYGPVNVPYKLLYPNTSDDTKQGGLNVKGIPNSVSI